MKGKYGGGSRKGGGKGKKTWRRRWYYNPIYEFGEDAPKLPWSNEEDMMYCPNSFCGITLRIGFRECILCGTPIHHKVRKDQANKFALASPRWRALIARIDRARREQRQKR